MQPINIYFFEGKVILFDSLDDLANAFELQKK